MKITLYQQNIEWCNPNANYRKVEEMLSAHPDTDLMVMPEMFTTGFVMSPREAEVETSEEVEQRLRALAAAHDCALAGSVAVHEGEHYYNRFYFVQPDGLVVYADKHHLFSCGGESRCYTAGRDRVVVNYRGIRFLLLVCYDLRFPVWSRCVDDYDVALYVANWPAVRQHSWEVLLQARAMENQCYVVGVNRVGEDEICPYAGGSMAVHPYGDPLVSCRRREEACVTFEPDMEMLAGYRQKFPALCDSDKFRLD